MAKLNCAAVIAAFIPMFALRPTPASAFGLAQPSGKWEVQYSDAACIAKRAYGKQTLAIRPSPMGQWTRVIIEGPGRAPEIRQYWSTVTSGDGGAPIKATSMIYPLQERGRRGLLTIFAVTDLDRLFRGGRIEVRSGLKNDPRVTFANREIATTSASLSLNGGPALRDALATCIADLRKSWGFDGDRLPAPAVPAKLISNVYGLFGEDDYPADAINASQTGGTAFMLLVDEQGNVADCAITESSGVASLDAMGCQVLTQRAKFVPAMNSARKPAKDIYFPPRILWQIER